MARGDHWSRPEFCGVNHHSAKLNPEKVRWALDQYFNQRRFQTDIARQLGVSQDTIYKVVNGITWKHVKWPV